MASLERWGYLRLFIDPETLKTATFLIANDQPNSTAFFVRVPLGNQPHGAFFGHANYVVTTRHSVKNTKVFIRFNLKEGGTEDKEVPDDRWLLSDTTDVAILLLEFPLDSYDITFVEYREFAEDKDYLIKWRKSEDETIMSLPYGEGDEIYTIGLFAGHPGQNLTQPVVRFGHIALKPVFGEKISAAIDPSEDLVPIDAFLVEMATWEGQSGSPVFLRPFESDDRTDDQTIRDLSLVIGMIQGFYPDQQDVKIKGKNETLLRLNTGIGIVVPSRDIMEVLMGKGLRAKRESLLNAKSQQPN